MNFVTLIDFGSTFTKCTVVSLREQNVVFTFRTPSTVKTDAAVGLRRCMDAIKERLGGEACRADCTLASSSAAGGLRMVVIGLTDSLSMMAGKHGACGAGAKVIRAFSRKLTAGDLDEIRRIQPEIILLCGGYEGGNSSWVWENADSLSRCVDLNVPIVYAGNSAVQQDICLLFGQRKKPCIIAGNIIPAIGVLDIASSVEAVRDIFMKRIVHMKGFDTVQSYVREIVMPTPAAVLEGVRLLARGTARHRGWGELLLADIGGATTDIHTYALQNPLDGVHVVGAPEPVLKRTVEGDIGVRESVNSLLEAADGNRLARLSGLSGDELSACRDRRLADHAFVADTAVERRFEQAAAMEAVRVSVRRHAGRLYAGFSGSAQAIQQGKDLRNVKAVIGTGGPIIDSLAPRDILRQALKQPGEGDLLLPEQAACYVDQSYIFYAAGLLARIDSEAAFQILQRSLVKLESRREG